MIKKFLLFTAFLFIVTPRMSFAAPVGNPADPVLLEGKYPTQFSLQAETVLERKLKGGTGGSPRFSGVFYTGKASVYIGKKLDIYATIGTYGGKVKDFIDTSYIIDSKMVAAWGLGVSYVFHEFEFLDGILRLGSDAKFRVFDPGIDKVKYFREDTETANEVMDFTEWQASLGLSYQYKNFVPYFGLKYSDMKSRIGFNQNGTAFRDHSIYSDNNIGLFYGIDILIKDNISVNIEGRNIDEKAANIGINARF